MFACALTANLWRGITTMSEGREGGRKAISEIKQTIV